MCIVMSYCISKTDMKLTPPDFLAHIPILDKWTLELKVLAEMGVYFLTDSK